jgi:hypothetical protein
VGSPTRDDASGNIVQLTHSLIGKAVRDTLTCSYAMTPILRAISECDSGSAWVGLTHTHEAHPGHVYAHAPAEGILYANYV